MDKKDRKDTIAQILADAIERALCDESPGMVFHPDGDFDPHIDVYLLSPTEAHRSWRLFTLGLSWPMVAARKSGESMCYPIEILLDLPTDVPNKDLRNAASMLQGISEYPFRHGSMLGPGTMIPLRKPIIAGTDLCGILFGSFCVDTLSAKIEQELPTHPKLLQAATLTGPERRATQTEPLWSLWNATILADPMRSRCSPQWLKLDGRTDDEVWALIELRAAVHLEAKRLPDALVAIREGLRLLEHCDNGRTLDQAAESLLWIGRSFPQSDKESSAECFEAAAAFARRSNADRAPVLIEAAKNAVAGEVSQSQLSYLGLFPTRSQDERLEWLGLSRSVGSSAIKAVPIGCASHEEYEPGPPLDFVIALSLAKPMKRSDLLRLFPQPWFVRHQFPDLRGRIAGEGRWVHVGTPGANMRERVYDAAKFVLRVFRPGAEKSQKWDLPALQEVLKAIREAAPEICVEPQSNPEVIIAGIPVLAHVAETYDLVIEVNLASEHGFDGRNVWDAMHEIGIQWGDDDAFNLVVPNPEGDECIAFKVTTTTEPGYFIPERIVTGTTYEKLCFVLDLPTLSNPEDRFDMMLEAARRAHEKLGGTLTLWNGEPLDEESLREEVHGLAEEMRGLGWLPGAARTKELF